MTSTRSQAYALALSLLMVLGGPAGWAQAAEGASGRFDIEDAAAKESYRKAIANGVSEYDAGHFEEALSCFRRAHQVSPNARTSRGMGMALFELRDYVAAIRYLTAALKDLRKPLSESQREEVQDLLDRSKLFVAVYTISVVPSDARVLLDGAAPEFQPDGKLMVGLGAHTLEARAKGYLPRTMSLNIRGGERKAVTLTLDPVPPPEPTVVATPPAPATDGSGVVAEPATSGSAGSTLWFLGSGASALLAGGAGVYWSIQNSNVSKCRHPASGPSCTNESQIVRQRNAGMGVTMAAGAAAVTMAIIGIVSWSSAHERSAQPSLSCVVGPFGVTCGGAF